MKKLALCVLGSLIVLAADGQARTYDTVAILILNRMSGVISEMESCSFKLSSESDTVQRPYGMVKMFSNFEVFMSGPDKMMMIARGPKGHRQFVYDGHQLAYYSFDENNYGVIPAPSTTIRTIDSINEQYGIEFPAADFFYPAFTDDVMENADSIRYLGMVTIDGKECFHILVYGKAIDLQIWVANDAYTLPSKFAIVYKRQEGNPQYMASFTEWNINPKLPDVMFTFLPPPGASLIRILSKNDQ